MDPIITVSDLGHVIELAVAPVFLLAGIAGFLNVMSGRLGRIIDRARVLERSIRGLAESTAQTRSRRELGVLWRRVNIIHWAIGFCTASALLTCLLIASLFIGRFMALNLAAVVAILFVAVLLLLAFALLLFINEVRLSTRTLRMGGEFVGGVSKK